MFIKLFYSSYYKNRLFNEFYIPSIFYVLHNALLIKHLFPFIKYLFILNSKYLFIPIYKIRKKD